SLNIVRQRQDNVTITRAMSNSFGFGGTNASLVFQKLQD
ncbi:MAG: 3-oxoacyl-[acyl-carrier-protein] synthase-1, partial [Paraglaciecola psychrophila]